MSMSYVQGYTQGGAGRLARVVDTLSTAEVAEQSGVSYRQLHYWMRSGVFGPRQDPGSGHRLRWDPDAVHLARTLAAISDAVVPAGSQRVGHGVPTHLLRRMVEAHQAGRTWLDLGAGVSVQWAAK